MTVMTRPVGELNGHHLHETETGVVYSSLDGQTPIGVAWGPTADNTGNWFASRLITETKAIRVDDRDAAIAYITTEAGEGQ